MVLPPLAQVPHLRRLMTPEEELIYTVKFHPLRGWPWLLLGALCLALSYEWPVALLPMVVFLGIWRLPLATNEVAITNQRLMLRTGMWRLLLETVEGHEISDWKMEQGPVGNVLNFGRIRIRIRDTQVRDVELAYVQHPLSFLEALEALQDGATRRGTA